MFYEHRGNKRCEGRDRVIRGLGRDCSRCRSGEIDRGKRENDGTDCLDQSGEGE